MRKTSLYPILIANLDTKRKKQYVNVSYKIGIFIEKKHFSKR